MSSLKQNIINKLQELSTKEVFSSYLISDKSIDIQGTQEERMKAVNELLKEGKPIAQFYPIKGKMQGLFAAKLKLNI